MKSGRRRKQKGRCDMSEEMNTTPVTETPVTVETIVSEEKPKRTAFQIFKEDYLGGLLIGGFLAVAFLIMFDKAEVMSASMEPTLMTGSHTLFIDSKFAGKLQRGDIIEFQYGEYVLCKRVIGLEGDVIEIADNTVKINGEILEEPYVNGNTESGKAETYVVPEGKIFVMGDNREHSNDSRYWDDPYVDVEDVRGVKASTVLKRLK